MADAANVQLIICFWKSFDLAKLQKELDETATQILNRQDDSDRSRRKLVELSKEFKRTSPEDAAKVVSPLLKSFQSEIDRLSKRSRAAEAAFLYIYKRIIDIVDPLPALEKCSDTNPNANPSKSSQLANDECVSSGASRQVKNKTYTEDPIGDCLSSIQSKETNHESTIKQQDKDIITRIASSSKRQQASCQDPTPLDGFDQRANNEINSTKLLALAATAGGGSDLFESSLTDPNVQDLQSALNQSQSSEIFENQTRNEKLFYAKNSVVVVDKTDAAINMSDSENDSKNEDKDATEEVGPDAVDSESHSDVIDLKKGTSQVNDQESAMDTSKSNSISTSSSPSPSTTCDGGLTTKEKEISSLVEDIQRLQTTIITLKETTARKISQLEEIVNEKNKIIKHLEARLERQQDYEEIKRELSLSKLDNISTSSLRDHKPFEMYLLEKTKALQTENAALKVANAELTNSLPRHLIPSFMPPFQSLGNVETFGSMLGEEIVSSYAKAFRREMAAAQEQNNSTNATGSPSPPPTSNDDVKSIGSDGETATPTSTSAINCNDEQLNNGNSPTNLERMVLYKSDSPISSSASYEKLQQHLRMNVEKYMNDNLNTLNISRCVRELLSVHNIGQRLFAKYILGLSQGTVSELLSKPKPWDKLTEKGRDSYRKMHAWAADETCIYLLKSMVPRKGKESTNYQKDDPAAEERIAQILSEAQRAMLSPNKNGSRGASGTPLVNGDVQIKSEKLNDQFGENTSDNGDERSDRPSPGSAAALAAMYRNSDRRSVRKFENDDIPQEVLNRIYQEELAKIIGQQVEEGFRHPHGIAGYERTQEEIRQALAIYHQELSRLTQIASAGASPNSNSELFARFTASAAAAAAGIVNGANYLGLPHLMDSGLPLDARIRSEKQANGSLKESRDGFTSSETDLRHGSAFSLVRPKQDSISSSKTFSSSSTTGQNGPLLTNSNNNDLNSAEDLSSAASPLQRMQSITNSLLSQSAMPSVPSTPSRPAKAVLPPITQQQFDQYNNLNTEDIVKKVKEQLSQYSISQRLFGESVLGLSQGSVSDLLARPKPWHMLTQKGREPFIRMKMFLEDENAIHKLVASQYKIAPEKLMRTGSFVAGGTSTTLGSGVSSTSNNASPIINSNSSLAAMKAGLRGQETSPIKGMESCRQSISPGYSDTAGHRSSTSTPEHHQIHQNVTSSAIHSSFSNANNISRRLGQNVTGLSRSSSSIAYMQPSVYEMAALTTDLDTQSITTKIKETLMAHNIGQKIFGEVVLGLSQGSVSELLSKPKPWHMLSIKGREPFIRMQLWLNDAHNIEKLQTLKNERREANKRRRNNLEEPITGKSQLDNHIYNFSSNYNAPGSLSGMQSSNNSSIINNRSSYGAPTAKKARILFSEEQKEALRVAFSMDPYPSTATIEFLANELNLSVRTITNWFHNHRMRLKQISSNNDESGSNPTQLVPYNLGRDGVNFDPIQFRMLLTQRLADLRLRSNSSPSHRTKFSVYGTSSISSSIYANTNSCSSPGSSLPEDEIGTLDLSMPSNNNSKKLNRLNEDSDESVESGGECDESVELDLSKNSRAIGSSRRKPQLVTSSSSRRKPAQPQWVDPGLEFSGDDDEDFVDDDAMSDEMIDDDDDDEAFNMSMKRNEIINGVCVRQTDFDIGNKRRLSLEDNETIRVEPTAALDASVKSTKNLLKEKERENKIKKLEKSIQEAEEGWDDDVDDEMPDTVEEIGSKSFDNEVDCAE